MARAAMAELSHGPIIPARSRSGLLVVSRTTIDYTPERYANSPLESVNLHPATADHKPGDKATKTKGEFDILYTENGPYAVSVGGNGANIAHRVSEFGIPVTVFTWGNEQNLTLLRQDLNHPRKSMGSYIEPLDGEIPGANEIPEAIVFPVKTKHGTVDRVILGTSPLMSSAFAHIIDKSWDHIVMNSLGEPNWRTSLRDGVDAAKDNEREFTFTPGSALLHAVRKGLDASAVYHTLNNAYSIMLTTGELEDLVRGAGQDPSTDKKRLLAQGLALGPQEIFATDGKNGAYAASVTEGMLWVDITQDDGVVSTLGAGDAFLAGALKNPYVERSLEERAIRGSASGSFAVETIGAHDNPPTEEQLVYRMDQRPVRVDNLNKKTKLIVV